MFWFCQVVSLVHVVLHLCGLLFVQLHSAVLQSWISLSFLNPFSALVICVLQICPCVNSSNHCEKLWLLTECEALFLYSFPSAAVSLPALCSVCEPQVLGHSTLALSLFLSLFYSLSLCHFPLWPIPTMNSVVSLLKFFSFHFLPLSWLSRVCWILCSSQDTLLFSLSNRLMYVDISIPTLTRHYSFLFISTLFPLASNIDEYNIQLLISMFHYVTFWNISVTNSNDT